VSVRKIQYKLQEYSASSRRRSTTGLAAVEGGEEGHEHGHEHEPPASEPGSDVEVAS
jgi:hypothetical protein